MIRVSERITNIGTKRLNGIQLVFANGDESPFLGKDHSAGYTEEHEISVDPTQIITGIQMKMWKDNLTGIRLHSLGEFDQENFPFVDYTWNSGQETGRWLKTQYIPPGQSIIGLMVNQQSSDVDIFRVAFLLWEKDPSMY